MGTSLKRKKKTKILILCEFPGQQGAKTVCIKTSINRLCKEITLDDDIYDLGKKYSMVVQGLSKEKLKPSHICVPPQQGLMLQPPEMGRTPRGVPLPGAAVWWLQSQLSEGTGRDMNTILGEWKEEVGEAILEIKISGVQTQTKYALFQ